jgi:hypothetical protein
MYRLRLFLILILFLWGIYFLVQDPVVPEPFVSGKCPTTLIKDGQFIYLYDSTMAKVPGVNPIQFNSLEEYKDYIEWQRANHLKCPILHLEKVYTANGTEMYEIRQNFMELEECGLQPESVSQLPIPFDPENQTQGMSDAEALSLETVSLSLR